MRRRTLLAVAGLLLLPGAAEAYIDPGTGSYLVQALVAGAMGALLAARTHWQRIKSLFGGGSGAAARGGADEEPADAAGPATRAGGDAPAAQRETTAERRNGK